MRTPRILLTVAALALTVSAAWAGSPHFVALSALRADDSLSILGKEAGLGNEPQVHIVVTATAACINPGQNHPKAANKESVAAEGDFPVQNGKANFALVVTATFQPDCAPPMAVVFTDVQVCDTTNGVCQNLAGTF